MSDLRSWITFEDIALDSSDFGRIGEDFLKSEAGMSSAAARLVLPVASSCRNEISSTMPSVGWKRIEKKVEWPEIELPRAADGTVC